METRLSALLLSGVLLLLLRRLRPGDGGGDPRPGRPRPRPTETAGQSQTQTEQRAITSCPAMPGRGPSTPSPAATATNLALAGLMYEGLFELDRQLRAPAGAVRSSTSAEDGLTWTFTLRGGRHLLRRQPPDCRRGGGLPPAGHGGELPLLRPLGRRPERDGRQDGTVTVTLNRAQRRPARPAGHPHRQGEREAPPWAPGPTCSPARGRSLALDGPLRLVAGQGPAAWTPSPCATMPEADDLIHAFDTRDISLVSTDLTGTNALGYSGTYEVWDYPTSTMLYVGFNCRLRPLRRRQACARPCPGAWTARQCPPPSCPATPRQPPCPSPRPAPSTTRTLAEPLELRPPGGGAAAGRRRAGPGADGLRTRGRPPGALPLWSTRTTPTGWPRRSTWPRS